jgi:hypothetical protein
MFPCPFARSHARELFPPPAQGIKGFPGYRPFSFSSRHRFPLSLDVVRVIVYMDFFAANHKGLSFSATYKTPLLNSHKQINHFSRHTTRAIQSGAGVYSFLN